MFLYITWISPEISPETHLKLTWISPEISPENQQMDHSSPQVSKDSHPLEFQAVEGKSKKLGYNHFRVQPGRTLNSTKRWGEAQF